MKCLFESTSKTHKKRTIILHCYFYRGTNKPDEKTAKGISQLPYSGLRIKEQVGTITKTAP